MTPPEFFFPRGFLETGAQQLSEWARIHLCPDLIVHSRNLSEPSPCLKQKACSS